MLLAKGTDENTTAAKGIRNEVQALKGAVNDLKTAVNDLEKAVKVLQCTSHTHESLLEALRKHTTNFEWQEGTLDLAYEGEMYEFMEE